MNLITILGLVAGVFTSLQFFPQIVKIRKEKKAKNVSFQMVIINCFGQVLWLIYALPGKNLPIIFNSLCALILNFILIWFKFKYKSNNM